MHLLLRVAYNSLGNRKKSFTHLYILYQMNPEDMMLKHTVGRFLFNEGKYQQALPYLKAAEGHPNCTQLCQQDLAQKLEKISQITKAPATTQPGD